MGWLSGTTPETQPSMRNGGSGGWREAEGNYPQRGFAQAQEILNTHNLAAGFILARRRLHSTLGGAGAGVGIRGCSDAGRHVGALGGGSASPDLGQLENEEDEAY